MTILQMILTVVLGICLSSAVTLGVCALVILRQEVERAHTYIRRIDDELVLIQKHVAYLLEKHG